MVPWITAAVFLAVAALTAGLGFYLWNARAQALTRLAPQERPVSSFIPSPSLVWQELVFWAGGFVPVSPKDLPRVKRRLVCAGFRDPQAARFLQGVRIVAAITSVLLALGAAARLHLETGNLLFLTAAAALFGYSAPMQYLSARIRRRRRAMQKGLPNVLDLMVVCVESGLGLDQTTLQVARELKTAHPEICEELAVMNFELRAGKRRAEALHNLAERTRVEDLRKLVAVLIQTERFGTSIAQSLRSHSDYMRAMARQRAEEKAAKLAVKLIFPIFFCVLPSLFVVTLGPVLTRLIRDLLPMIENM